MEGTIDLAGAKEFGTSSSKRPIQKLPSKVGFVLRMERLELESSSMRIMIDKINTFATHRPSLLYVVRFL